MKKQLLPVIFCVMISTSVSSAQFLNTGWKRPTATHFPNDWTNPQNAFGSDDMYAEVLHQSGCRCPFMDLSWDNGTNYSSSNIFGPYGTTDSYRIQGDSTDGWGHSWTDAELNDSTFVLRIWNSSTLLRQGYANFGFGIPAGSNIGGIEVRVEAHGDSSYLMDFVDIIEVNVYYLLPTPVNEVYSSLGPVNVFPNPAHDAIHMHFIRDSENEKIQIINIRGQMVAESIFSNILAGNDYAMDVSRLEPGIYFLNIVNGQRAINTRIAIQ